MSQGGSQGGFGGFGNSGMQSSTPTEFRPSQSGPAAPSITSPAGQGASGGTGAVGQSELGSPVDAVREQLQGNELALGIFEMTQTLRRFQEPILSGEELILLAFRGIIIRVAGRFAQKTGYQLNLNPHKKSIT